MRDLGPADDVEREGGNWFIYAGNFTKSNGQTTENKLESIEMPNGHEIEFTWGNGTNAPTNRIRTASDGVRTVTYGYTNGLLTSVTTPAGKVTGYGYANPYTGSNFTEDSATDLLSSITDPRGLSITISYAMGWVEVKPYGYVATGPLAYKVSEPNGIQNYINPGLGIQVPPEDANGFFSAPHDMGSLYLTKVGSMSGETIGDGAIIPYTDNLNPLFNLKFRDYNTGSPRISLEKTYNIFSQDLMTEIHYIKDSYTQMVADRRFKQSDILYQSAQMEKVYNFMGNPLSVTNKEYVYPVGGSNTLLRTATVNYAYWGKEKYYQQKAVKDQAGRYSFTDYYDWNATQGKKGQTYRVYDEKRSNWGTDSGAYVPPITPSQNVWKYNLVPADANAYSAQFDYDSKGRPTDVWKIQSTTTNPWTYVQTKTTYGADSAPTWGAATQVVEDYGSGKINRTTSTLAYDSIGRAIKVQDAKGQQFETNYDLDGVVQSVHRTDSGLNQLIVGYTYGTSGLTNGAVTQLVDGLSGVQQDFTYTSSGGGLGAPASVTETNGSNSYTTSYTYNAAGERETATYTTPNGTTTYKYSDYVQVGNAASSSRVFQTLNKTNSGVSTSEEFHYHYDSAGRLIESLFAQSPQTGGGAPTSAPYYTASYPAATRARAYYTYDSGSRVTNVEHYWDSWGGSSYTSTPIVGNSCAYELTGSNRGLKTANSFYVNNSGSWALQRTEYYGYDADLDYLTSADYNDGLANENPSWSYDAAGNRNDATVVDNLNRATTIGGVSRTYDILGNTLTNGSSVSYGWDALNRMTSFTSGTNNVSYQYRADGMRTKKVKSGQTDWFYYDGQMPVETAEIGSSSTVVTRNSLGARGIDRIERVGSSTTVGYPLYDGHGNMVATLTKSGSSFSFGDARSYDAWGVIRSGNATGDPKGRYVANLGHVDDDELGLIYMRARYYETGSGRFVSEDPNRAGSNWYSYCDGDPVNYVDESGRSRISDAAWQRLADLLKLAGGVLFGAGFFLILGMAIVAATNKIKMDGAAVKLLFIAFTAMAIGYVLMNHSKEITGALRGYYESGGEIPIISALFMLGEAGLMIMGLGMGVSEDDADASVWGF